MLQVVKVLVLSCLVNSAGNEEKRGLIIISIFDVLPKAKITAFREAPPGDFVSIYAEMSDPRIRWSLIILLILKKFLYD
ncbi:Protein CBG27298 [Caenorhabditis briggsae]|uniref:Protein CBG27298 n=1 Tax=Caenorhabditis briggsae TaxID=6238 RepID=B6IM75_CAEBR|nr:Protein CBG27298 [Caenorhabditis briggsae]CAS01005.1 Protein CBG27298 [Caenorhabditis briggsae]